MIIPYGRHKLFNSDIKAAINTLKSNFITQGPIIKQFEQAIVSYCKSKYAVTSNSATSSLHIACLSLGLNKNDILWTVPNTFVASANCGLYCGAKVDFVDIDKYSLNIDIEKLENKLNFAKKKNKLPKILVPVHFGGQPTLQEDIFKLSKKFNFKIIEDASHSLGSERNKIRIGNSKWSDITVFSFHPVKMITTIEGGVATTDSKRIYKLMKLFSSHGIEKNTSNFIKKPDISNYYEMQKLGFNYRMNDVQASIGLSQLSKVDKFVKKRNKIANVYKNALKDLPVRFQKISKGNLSSYHLFTINFLDIFHINNKNKIIKELYKQNIQVGIHYIPVHFHPYYYKLGFRKKMFPISEDHYKSSISMPIFYDLLIKDVEDISIKLKKIISKL